MAYCMGYYMGYEMGPRTLQKVARITRYPAISYRLQVG
jgi:hypothetical protein